MKKKSSIRLTGFLLAFMLLLTGCTSRAISALGIEALATIDSITVETWEGVQYYYDEPAQIQAMNDLLLDIEEIGESVDLYPAVEQYGKITVECAGVRQMYYYQKDGRWYVEVPMGTLYLMGETVDLDRDLFGL